MREILFRGKNEKSDEWVYGGLVHQTDYYGSAVDDYYIVDGTDTQDNDIGFEYRVTKETVGQYTGYTDVNNVKIFEGDIVSVNDNNEFGGVAWDIDDSKFVIVFDTYAIGFDDIYNWEVDVVGNIYDNPEILED